MKQETTQSLLCERLSSMLSRLEAKVDALASGPQERRECWPNNTKTEVVNTVTKVCPHCQQEKDLAEFYQFYDKWTSKKFHSTRCKPCHQKYKHTNPNTQRNRKSDKLKLRYGLDYEQWQKIREQQNYSCMICGITEEELGKKLDVDHCHSSGVVRGVLCNPCNTTLGHARDSVEVLEAAARYLKQNADGYKP